MERYILVNKEKNIYYILHLQISHNVQKYIYMYVTNWGTN